MQCVSKMNRIRPIDILLRAYRRSGLRGFHALHRVWTRLSGSPYIRVRSSRGVLFEILPTGYVEKFIIEYGFYESEVFDAVSPYLQEGAAFWDIGANLGLHAVTAKCKHPGLEVVAFEPVPKLRDRIRANASLNGADVQIAGIALSNVSGPADLHVPEGAPGGLASLKKPRDGAHARVAVECFRADEIIQSGQYSAPTVIKLDVEGAELEVLEGLGKHLRSPTLQAVVFEGAPDLERGPGKDPVADLLRAAGFVLRRLDRKEPTEHLLENYLASR